MFDKLLENFIKRRIASSVLLALMSSPDDHSYMMEVEGDEIVIRIKRKKKEKESSGN